MWTTYWTIFTKTIEDIKKSASQPYALISVIKHGRKDKQNKKQANKQSLEIPEMYVGNIEEEQNLGVMKSSYTISIIFQVSVNMILH